MNAVSVTSLLDSLITDHELCERLNVGRRTTYEARKTGDLPFVWIGGIRYTPEHIATFLANRQRRMPIAKRRGKR